MNTVKSRAKTGASFGIGPNDREQNAPQLASWRTELCAARRGAANFMPPANRKRAASSTCTVHSNALTFFGVDIVVSPFGFGSEPPHSGSPDTTNEAQRNRQLLS